MSPASILHIPRADEQRREEKGGGEEGRRGEGGHAPSFEPTVLKYPAENPPVNAPCSLLRPFSSRTSCFHSGTNSPVSFDFSSGGRGVPIYNVYRHEWLQHTHTSVRESWVS